MKKIISLLLAVLLVLSAFTACGNTDAPAEDTTPSTGEAATEDTSATETTEAVMEESKPVEVLPNFMVMSGPTGVGAAKLISDWENGESTAVANVEIVSDNEAVKNALVSGAVDIAAVATNLAATLSNKLDGGIQVLAINTLGVLYILERGDSVQTMADLEGKTLYATGQGANPEYILNYLLTKSGVAPSSVDIQWMTAQEVIAKMATEESAICMLPVPAATTVLIKYPEIRQAISLSQVWDSLGNGALAQGCIVVRTEYAEENPEAVAAFLDAYAASLDYMMNEANREDAANLVAQYGITANPQIAKHAIPACNLTFITGDAMKDILVRFYEVMYQADPSSIGGAMPADAFYYGAA